MLEDVKRIDESRKRMIADVSHELRTPLTIIKGEADIALRGDEKSLDSYREALERTCEAANHTAILVDDLLFVARSYCATQAAGYGGGGVNILVVEDEHRVSDFIIRGLRSEGWLAEYVDNGESALDHLARHEFDIVLRT